MRMTGNGRRYRGAAGLATGSAAGPGVIPGEANVGAGTAGSGVVVVVGGSGTVSPGGGVAVGVAVGVGVGAGRERTTGAVGADLTSTVKPSIVAVAVTISRDPRSATTGT